MTSRLISIGPDWWMWPIVHLRSAGYPADRVLDLIAETEAAGSRPERLRDVVAGLAHDDWLREALCWQNLKIVSTWLQRYADEDAATWHREPARYRNKLLTLGIYVQRYAMKNETVGFFGPWGWAKVDPSADCVVEVAGRGTKTRQRTDFEPWALSALAERWAGDPRVRWHLPIRMNEAGLLRGSTFDRPRRGAYRLRAEQQAVLELARNGPVIPSDVLAALRTQHRGLGPLNEERLTAILDELQDADCLWWGFELPVVHGLDRLLADQLSGLPEGELRSGLLAQMDRLCGLREAVANSAGRPEAVATAMDALGNAFEAATGVSRSMSKRARLDSRNLLFHDVTVDWNATVGSRAITELAGAMELIMAICRYVTWRLAHEVEELARSVLGGLRLPFEDVFYQLLPDLDSGRITETVMAEVRTRIVGLLDLASRTHDAHRPAFFRGAELRDRWLDTFAAPHAGWSAGRTHSPDVMLAIDGEQHFWVLGEVHMAMNTLDYRACLDSQPEPGELESLVDAATCERFIPAFPAGWPRITPRTYPPPATALPRKHHYWTLWSRSAVVNSVSKLPCLDLTVEDHPDGVLVLDQAGQPLTRLTEFIGEFLSIASSAMFDLIGEDYHCPRIQIDDLVIQRESWHLPVREFAQPLASSATEAEIRSLFEAKGIPRYTFVRVPGQPKPMFCDVASWVMTRNVVRVLRKPGLAPDSVVRIQEMLPAFEQIWLKGPAGRVSSEFRLVFQDRAL